MGGKSNYLELKALDHIFGAAFTAPGTVYVGLWTATLDDTSTGATAGEPGTANAYARQAMAAGTAQWTAASAGSVSNQAVITFPANTTADWGTITYVGITDNSAAGAGNMLYWGALTASKVVQVGDTFSFAQNALVISED